MRLNYITAGIAALSMPVCVVAQDAIRDSQDMLREWIQVEKQVSSDVNQWAMEKEILQDTIRFLKLEKERLDSVIEESEESASASERKRAELEEQRAGYRELADHFRSVVGDYEARIQEMVSHWPQPFLAEIRTPLGRIPSEENADSVSLSIRLQNIAAILNQFDRFNSTVTRVSEIQSSESGNREVTRLYFGVGFAYFVDASGSYGGYGKPGSDGWVWTEEPSLIPDIMRLTRVYDRTAEAVFVGLPIDVQ